MKTFIAILVLVSTVGINGYLTYKHDFSSIGWFWSGAVITAVNVVNKEMKE